MTSSMYSEESVGGNLKSKSNSQVQGRQSSEAPLRE